MQFYRRISSCHFSKFHLIPLILFASFFKASSQENNSNGQWISANLHYGMIVPHVEHMQYLITGHAWGCELTYHKDAAEPKAWRRDYNFPETGISFLYMQLSGSSTLGFGASLHPYINFPLIKKKNYGLNFKTAASVGYMSDVFHRVNNYKNNAIGSHLNCFINFKINSRHVLSENSLLEYGLGLTHFSNGAFSMPNLGINITTLNIGLTHKIGRISTPFAPIYDTGDPDSTKFSVTVIAGGSRAEVQPPVDLGYPAFTVSASFDFMRSQKHRFLIGTELGYNGANVRRLEADDIYITSKTELLQSGAKLGYALRVGSFELPLELGYYLYTLTKSNGYYFQRVGMRYYLKNNVVLNLTLKSHWAVAEYLEFGVGYTFRIKK